MPLPLLSLLLLLSLTPPTHSRRLLHQPLFPLPLPQPPSPPPTISFPKYPSSTNPLQPFFPFYRSPPSPPTSQPSSNLSSLVFPNPQTTPPKHSKPHHVLPILLPLLAAVIVLCFAGVFVFRRRRRRSGLAESRTETRRLFSVTSVSGEVPKFAPSTSSGPIFSGPAVTATTTTDDNSNFVGSPYRKLDSPELRPLPPLSRNNRHNYVNAEGGGASSDEEFYSPRGSSKAASGRLSNSGSRMVFEAQMADKFGFRTSNLSSPSYGSSNSVSSPTPPSSGSSSPRRFSAVKNLVGSGNAGVYPPPRPPPPPPIGPLTPSPPPRRKPHSSSVSPKTQTSEESPNRSPVRNGGLKNDSFVVGPSPPPPPPPPPVGYWESKISTATKPTLTNPPVLAPPRHIGSRNPTESAVFATDMKASSDDPDNSTETTPRPKLKPLHWDKVRASSDREMVWDQLRSSSFKVNEEMIETLFMCKPVNSTPKEVGRRPGIPTPSQENRVLDPKKSQNIAILLRALNVTKEEVCEALLEGNTDSLGTELMETLLKMAPNKEEEFKLKEYKDDSPFKLGPAEKFLKAVLDIPFAFKRVEAMLYIANFDSEVNFLRKSFQTLEAACEELRTNRMLMKLLEAVLKTGNRMNVGTNRGDAHAFKLDTLLKLVDVKGTDGKTTLLHFVVQEIIRSEGLRLATSEGENLNHTLENEHVFKRLGLRVVAGLSVDLKNVKKAAATDSNVLSSYVSKLASGIGKINEVIRQNTMLNSQDGSQKFEKAMNEFSRRAEDEIIKIQAQESVALSVVKEITEYFHGNSAREEAHPFRIFMVVRDFLSSLDQVCKEVGQINEKTGTGRHFPVPVNPTLGPIFPTFQAQRAVVSSDDGYNSS